MSEEVVRQAGSRPAPAPQFSREERRYIALMAAQPRARSGWMRFVNSGVFFAPSIFLGIYGISDASLKITGVAFVTLVISLFWSLAGVFREQRYAMLANSVFAKLQDAISSPIGEDRPIKEEV
ncbi:hypothetical protein DTW90_19645 [Neorhizobium sp. P12A]|jgi:hypothetical protein|uniref:hypothetical protein n=1 Tax=Neorhizobium sp. P12A TaxID=2268027 RepID=UPI0011EF9745|nr:hypothetical protein [Neorhizobium sp. P12A]KAA0697602.1 hypothetical protein DTW90_19645 [Neorhizobium sp. P12A]